MERIWDLQHRVTRHGDPGKHSTCTVAPRGRECKCRRWPVRFRSSRHLRRGFPGHRWAGDLSQRLFDQRRGLAALDQVPVVDDLRRHRVDAALPVDRLLLANRCGAGVRGQPFDKLRTGISRARPAFSPASAARPASTSGADTSDTKSMRTGTGLDMTDLAGKVAGRDAGPMRWMRPSRGDQEASRSRSPTRRWTKGPWRPASAPGRCATAPSRASATP